MYEIGLSIIYFYYFSNSLKFKILIRKIDNNNAIVIDCETGKIIRKFQNFEDDYSVSCQIAPTKTANLTNIVSKSGKHSIFFNFNYLNGREDIILWL